MEDEICLERKQKNQKQWKKRQKKRWTGLRMSRKGLLCQTRIKVLWRVPQVKIAVKRFPRLTWKIRIIRRWLPLERRDRSQIPKRKASLTQERLRRCLKRAPVKKFPRPIQKIRRIKCIHQKMRQVITGLLKIRISLTQKQIRPRKPEMSGEKRI